MGTLTGTYDVRGAVVNGVTLGEPGIAEDGSLLWDHAAIPDGEAEPVPVVERAGVLIADVRFEPAEDYVVSAERADIPVAIRVTPVDVDPVEVGPVEVEDPPTTGGLDRR